MSVHLSLRRLFARFQNTYEDETDEVEQHLLQPADRPDHREHASCSAMGSRRSSPQDNQPRHTQLHSPVRKFADRQFAANDVPFGPCPDATLPTNLVGERLSETEHADPTNLVGDAALPPSAAEQPTDSASRPERQQPQQRNLTSFDPGGGRGLSSSSSEPFDEVADLEQKSAFYRNATYARTSNSTPLTLPELPIQKFNGDIRSYPVFRNHFLELVEGRQNVGPRQKLQYLLQFLSDEPLEEARRYMITDVNYYKVIDRMESRYGNRERLLMLLNQCFIDLKPPDHTARDVRRFHGEASSLVDEMQRIGEDVDNDSLLRQTLVTKLPPHLREKVLEKISGDPLGAPVSELLARLADRLLVLEACEVALSWDAVIHQAEDSSRSAEKSLADDTSDLGDQPCRSSPEPPLEAQRVTAAATTTNADNLLQERRTCPLCSYLHSAADCTVHDTTNKRLRRALKKNLCLLCLREGHPAASCPRRTTRPCRVCRRGQHNRAFCKDAADDNHARDRRPSQVCATKGSRFDPEESDQQRHSRTSAPAKLRLRIAEQSVIRDVTCCVTTATTLRQSSTQSSRERGSGNPMNRKKRTKDPGTHPPGRPGTNRPSTTSTDESIKQNGADVYGRDRCLPGRDNLLPTDRCSTTRETLQFDRTMGCGSDGVPCGMPDEKLSRELFNDEDVSHQASDGHCSDASFDVPEDGFPPNEECTAYVACASANGPQQRAPTNLVGPSAVPSSADEPPDVLHECLAVTATNPVSKTSRRAVIMFDSGSSFNHVSSKLARTLDLPRHKKRVQLVGTFGSKTPMALNGFRTFLVLRSSHGRCLQVNVTVIDCIVSSVRTALVRDADLPALRRNDCTPTSTREMPDLLIGQDLVHLFDRQLEPTLPNGLYIVMTSMGPTVGGACRSVTPPTKALTSFGSAATHPAAEDTDVAEYPSRLPLSLPPSKKEPSPSRLQLRLQDVTTDPPTNLVGSPGGRSSDDHANSPPKLVGGSVVHVIDEFLEPSSSLSFFSGPQSLPFRAPGVLPQSPQKQSSSKPLDTQPLLLPTTPSTSDVEEVSATNLCCQASETVPEPLCSMEDQLRCSLLPTPPHGDTIGAFCDARSTLQRKTRLRPRLPVYIRQHLGIYTAPEPVLAVTLLLQSDPTFVDRQAEPNLQLVRTSPSLLRSITIPPTSTIQYGHGPALLRGPFSAIALPAVAAEDSPRTASGVSPKDFTSSWLSDHPAIAPSADEDPACSGHLHTTSVLESSIRRHHFRPTHLSAESPANLAGGSAFSCPDNNPYPSTNLVGDMVVHVFSEPLETSPSTTHSSGQPTSPPRAPDALPQKQFTSKPVNTRPLLLPAYSAIYVEVEEVSATNLVARPPRPIQDPLSSTKDELRCSTPPPSTMGDPIRAHLCDAASILPRRRSLPYFGQQPPGICATSVHMPSVTVLRISDFTWILPPQAETERQLVRTSSALQTYDPPFIVIRCCLLPQLCSVPLTSAFTTIVAAVRRHLHDPAAAIYQFYAFGRTGSHSDRLRWLRSPIGLPAHARMTTTRSPLGSAHQQPPAQDALKTDADTGLQPRPQPLASYITSRVRIDPQPKPTAEETADDTFHCWSLRPSMPTAFVHLLRSPASRAPAADMPVGSCLTSSGLATNRAIMGNRKPKTSYNTSAQGMNHSSPPHFGRRKAERRDTGRQPTADLAKKAEPSVLPTNLVGTSGYALQDSTTRFANHHAPTRTSSTRRPTDPRNQKSATPSATLSTQAKPPATQDPILLQGPSARAQASRPADQPCRSDHLSYSIPGTSRAADQPRRHSRARRSGPTPAPPRPTEAPHKRAHKQPPPTEDALIDQLDARQTSHQDLCTTDAVRHSLPPRGPRADLVDQMLPASRRGSTDPDAVYKHAFATHCQATGATQEPLEPLSVAWPLPCAFCGQSHPSCECDLYTTICQRLRRIGHLGLCFSCLGRDHQSAACPSKTTTCSLCRKGRHHEAFCRDAALHMPPSLQHGPKQRAPTNLVGPSAPPSSIDARAIAASAASRAAPATISSAAGLQTSPAPRRAPNTLAPAADAPVAGRKAPSVPRRAPTTSAPAADVPVAGRRASSLPASARNRRTCAFCQSHHWSQKCTAYVSISQRLRRAQQLRLCFTCLREGHLSSGCPTDAKTCRYCSKAIHHRSLCRNSISSHRHSVELPANIHVDGNNRRKKRVNTACVRLNDRPDCPPKNETICFCDASTFHQFGRQLRPGVQMFVTPIATPADATNFVCRFRPTTEVKRVIFWFSSDCASLNHVELVRLVIELSQYYTMQYKPLLQYIVVSPSVSSRQDVWTYGIFKFLVQAEVLLLEARLSMPPPDLLQDAAESQAIRLEDRRQRAAHCETLHYIEDVKHYLRERHQLDLWSRYSADRRLKPTTTPAVVQTASKPCTTTAKVGAATNLVALHTSTTPSTAEAATNLVAPPARAPPPTSATTAEQNLRVTDVQAATDAGTTSKFPATPDAATPSIIDATAIAASQPASLAYDDTRVTTDVALTKDLAPQAPGLDDRTENFVSITDHGP